MMKIMNQVNINIQINNTPIVAYMTEEQLMDFALAIKRNELKETLRIIIETGEVNNVAIPDIPALYEAIVIVEGKLKEMEGE